MNLLTIDRGNTSIKAIAWCKSETLDSLDIKSGDWFKLIDFAHIYKIDRAILASVVKEEDEFDKEIKKFFERRLMIFTSRTPTPLKINYSSLLTLGVDRLAASVGAFALNPEEGVLVVDSGTALTIDVVAKGGIFQGGNIYPGEKLRFRSLKEWTSALPLVGSEGEIPEFGFDTATAIRSGVVRGMADEIAGAFHRARNIYGVSKLCLTGGNANVILPFIPLDTEIIDYNKNLVGYGLLKILDYNKD